jgi:hypothetical protein
VKNRPLILGVTAAVITIAIGVVAVLAIDAGNDDAGGSAAPKRAAARRSTTTTSAPGRTTTTTSTIPATASTTLPVTGPQRAVTPPATEAPEAPDPPNPVDQYHPIPLPPGISATISTCNWSPVNGGELQATGTVTNVSADDDVWFVNVYWLVHNQTQDEDIDSQSELYDLAQGQSIPWRLTTSAPESPPNLSCALEVD